MECVSLVKLWNYLQGQQTKDGAEICVTSETADWDGTWPAPNEAAISNSYFDLKKNGVTLCMDGEECECHFDSERNVYVCTNIDFQTAFVLTPEEFDVCTFR